MRLRTCFSITGTVAFALSLALAAPQGAWADRSVGQHHVDQTTYVRTNPNGFVIGTILGGSFSVLQSHASKGEVWGKAGGHADRCGWVQEAAIARQSSGNGKPSCNPGEMRLTETGNVSRDYLLKLYALDINDRDAGPGHYSNNGCRVHLNPGPSY